MKRYAGAYTSSIRLLPPGGLYLDGTTILQPNVHISYPLQVHVKTACIRHQPSSVICFALNVSPYLFSRNGSRRSARRRRLGGPSNPAPSNFQCETRYLGFILANEIQHVERSKMCLLLVDL